MKEIPSGIRIDPRTGEVIMSADTFLKGVSAREEAVEDRGFDELRELMEEAPGGEKSPSLEDGVAMPERERIAPPGVKDTRGIKVVTELNYKGRLSGGTPKDALEVGKRKHPAPRPPRKL